MCNVQDVRGLRDVGAARLLKIRALALRQRNGEKQFSHFLFAFGGMFGIAPQSAGRKSGERGRQYRSRRPASSGAFLGLAMKKPVEVSPFCNPLHGR